MVDETNQPGVTVSLLAQRHGAGSNQQFTWLRFAAQGAVLGGADHRLAGRLSGSWQEDGMSGTLGQQHLNVIQSTCSVKWFISCRITNFPDQLVRISR